MHRLDAQSTVLALKAAAEPTRLRILALLGRSELNVSDLTRILGQSQPRISRHLKLLAEAGVIDRFREGSWAYFQLSELTAAGRLAQQLIAAIDAEDPVLVRDWRRAVAIKAEREAAAQAYFREHAAEWDRIRSLYVAEDEVEAAVREALAGRRYATLVDLGTGTGRMLEVLAGDYDRGVGIDVNQAMLAYARSRLDRAGLAHAQVRHGDIYSLPLDDGRAEAVVMHQVLHFLSDPARAIAEAARVLAPGGKLVIVDFAAHEMDELRTRFRHERLGFASAQIRQWMQDAELEPAMEVALPGGAPRAGTLTVVLWQALRPHAEPLPAAGRRSRTPDEHLETMRGSP